MHPLSATLNELFTWERYLTSTFNRADRSRITWLIFFRRPPRNWNQSRTRDQRNIDSWFCCGAITKTKGSEVCCFIIILFFLRNARTMEIDDIGATSSSIVEKNQEEGERHDKPALPNFAVSLAAGKIQIIFCYRSCCQEVVEMLRYFRSWSFQQIQSNGKQYCWL